MDFSRPEYWSGEPFPSSRDLPNPGIELRSPTLQADSIPAEPQGSPYLNLKKKKIKNDSSTQNIQCYHRNTRIAVVKKTENVKCWQASGTTRVFMQCW